MPHEKKKGENNTKFIIWNIYKKILSERWNDFNDIKIQRDMYFAFLIMNINDDLKSFDINKCNAKFEDFYYFHTLEVDRLIGCKNLKSIGI